MSAKVLQRIRHYISIIEKLRIRSDKILQGMFAGMHRSPYLGYTADFEDHRQYNPGDNIKLIDWPLWARSEKLFIKRFKEDTNANVYLILDSTLSMAYPSEDRNKLDRAKELLILLFLLFRSQNDRVALFRFNEGGKFIVAPNDAKIEKSSFIEKIAAIEAERGGDFAEAMKVFSRSAKRRGIVVLASDFIFDTDTLKKGLNILNYHKHDILCFHMYAEKEVDAGLLKEGVYFDPEARAKSVSADESGLRNYRENFLKREIEIREIFNELRIKRIKSFAEDNMLKFILGFSAEYSPWNF